MTYSFKYFLSVFSILLIGFIFSGCEKEIGDVLLPESISPFEGEHTISITGNLTGQKEIEINNRGNFAFFVELFPPGSNYPAYPIIITGFVTKEGNLEGKVYRYQEAIGVINGQLAQGNISFDYSGFHMEGIYNMTGGN